MKFKVCELTVSGLSVTVKLFHFSVNIGDSRHTLNLL